MWRWGALGLACLMAAPSASATVSSALPSSVSASGSQLAQRLLAVHNQERRRLGIRPLAWDPSLAAAAASYSAVLAGRGLLAHSPAGRRPGQLENLWMGTRGAFSLEDMVGSWVAERSRYRPGVFPAVSRTGRWNDVAHYTQLIWPSTTHVGCAVQRAAQWDYLVCRYSPPGNVMGSRTP